MKNYYKWQGGGKYGLNQESQVKARDSKMIEIIELVENNFQTTIINILKNFKGKQSNETTWRIYIYIYIIDGCSGQHKERKYDRYSKFVGKQNNSYLKNFLKGN